MTDATEPKYGRYFVFRDYDGKIKVRSWKRYYIERKYVLAWSDDLKEARRIAREYGQEKAFL